MLRYAVSRMQSSLAGQGGRMMLSETYLKAQNTDLLVPAVCFAVVLLTLHFLMVYSGFSADVPDRPVRKSEVSEKNVRFCARPGSRVRCGNSCCAGARLSVARAADCAVLRCDSSSDRILRRFLPPEISVVLSTHPMTGGTMPGNSNPSLFSMESHTL